MANRFSCLKSQDYQDKVIKIAKKHGYWGEGIGLEHNEAITGAPFYDRLVRSATYRGSWDQALHKSGTVKPEDKMSFLYSLFANLEANKRVENLLTRANKGEKIFDLLVRTIPDWSADEGAGNLNKTDLINFLREISEEDIDFVELSNQEATEENLRDFLTKGEELMWPENWNEYPNKAGKLARNATTIRDQYLINAGPGVYFVGAGHLKDIANMEEAKKKGLKLIGGENIGLQSEK